MNDAHLDQLTVTASDFGHSLAFYNAVFAAVGLCRLVELVDEEADAPEVEAAAWGRPDGPAFFWLLAGEPATTGLHLRLKTGCRAQVEAFHAVGVQHGGASRARPRRWPIYRRGEFGAMLADPDGNLIEAVAPE